MWVSRDVNPQGCDSLGVWMTKGVSRQECESSEVWVPNLAPRVSLVSSPRGGGWWVPRHVSYQGFESSGLWIPRGLNSQWSESLGLISKWFGSPEVWVTMSAIPEGVWVYAQIPHYGMGSVATPYSPPLPLPRALLLDLSVNHRSLAKQKYKFHFWSSNTVFFTVIITCSIMSVQLAQS